MLFLKHFYTSLSRVFLFLFHSSFLLPLTINSECSPLYTTHLPSHSTFATLPTHAFDAAPSKHAAAAFPSPHTSIPPPPTIPFLCFCLCLCLTLPCPT